MLGVSRNLPVILRYVGFNLGQSYRFLSDIDGSCSIPNLGALVRQKLVQDGLSVANQLTSEWEFQIKRVSSLSYYAGLWLHVKKQTFHINQQIELFHIKVVAINTCYLG